MFLVERNLSAGTTADHAARASADLPNESINAEVEDGSIVSLNRPVGRSSD